MPPCCGRWGGYEEGLRRHERQPSASSRFVPPRAALGPGPFAEHVGAGAQPLLRRYQRDQLTQPPRFLSGAGRRCRIPAVFFPVTRQFFRQRDMQLTLAVELQNAVSTLFYPLRQTTFRTLCEPAHKALAHRLTAVAEQAFCPRNIFCTACIR